MIMQAIIEAVNDDGTCYVNILNFTNTKHKSASTRGYLARFSVIPNAVPNVRPGDRVYVGFLNNNVGDPVILGHMYFQNPDISARTNSTYSLKVADLETTSHTQLSANTDIGNITAKEISYLQGLSANLQSQLRVINERLSNLEQQTGVTFDLISQDTLDDIVDETFNNSDI